MGSVVRIEEPCTAPPPYLLSDKTEITRNVGVYHINLPDSPSPPPPHPSPLHALMTCDSCQIQVTTQVSFRVGTHAWFMCLVFVLCGLFLGCCLIPFFVDHFKDVYHTCPHCQRVLHVHRRACFK